MRYFVASRNRKWIFGIGRFLLGAIFIYAAVMKISSPQEFADKIAAFQMLPAALINLLAMGLPLFEFACGLFVLSGFYLRIGALGILAMLGVFSGALCLAVIRGLSIECGCFGAHSWLDTPWIALTRDLMLLMLAGLVYTLGKRPDTHQG